MIRITFDNQDTAMSRSPSLRWILTLSIFLLPCTALGQGGDSQSLLEGKIYNPTFSPSSPSFLAYERQVEDTRELYLYRYPESNEIRQVTAVEESQPEEDAGELSMFGQQTGTEIERFEGQLAWRPVLDPEGHQWFVFVSSAAASGSGLFLSYVTPDGRLADATIRLPFEGQATSPEWSPDGRQLVFAGVPSGTTGRELFLFSDMNQLLAPKGSSEGPLQSITALVTGEGDSTGTSPIRLTDNPSGNLYPTWSPEGNYIAYQARQEENGTLNWGINLLDVTTWSGTSDEKPRSIRVSQMFDGYNEYKPSWSADGERIAFYIPQSKVGRDEDQGRQDIAVLSLVTGPQGRIRQGNQITGISPRPANNVLVNESRGPEWYSASGSRWLTYVKKNPDAGNPIRVVNVSQWEERSQNYDEYESLSAQFDGETRLHKEVAATLASGSELRLAFAANAGETDRLQVQTLSGLEREQSCCVVRQEVSRSDAMWRSAVFPGWGQLHKDDRRKALIFGAAGAATLLTVGVGQIVKQNKVNDYNGFVENWWVNGDKRSGPLTRRQATIAARKFRDKYDGATSATLRNAALIAFAGTWAWSMFDSFQGFPRVVDRPLYTSEQIRVESPRLEVSPIVGAPRMQLTLSVRF